MNKMYGIYDQNNKMTELTLQDFKKKFPDDDVCLEWLRNKLYPKKIYCDACQMPTFHHKIKSRKTYECDRCGSQMSPTTGTIFYKSSTPLTIWFYVIYRMAQTRNGISAKQIQRETGVTYKTAWRMCKEIRNKFEDNNLSTFIGDIELSENYLTKNESESTTIAI